MPNANDKIKAAMKKNERDIIAHIRKYGSVSYQRSGMSWMKAIDRLQEKGKVRYSAKDFGYVETKKRK